MRQQYLGDALDFWKRGILDVVRESRPLCVVPMFTDDPWPQDALDAYAPLAAGQVLTLIVHDALHVGHRAHLLDLPLEARTRLSVRVELLVEALARVSSPDR